MNILWLSHNIPYPPVGGVLQRNYNLLKQVAAKHAVYLLAFNQKGILSTKMELVEARRALNKICARVEIISIPSDRSKISWYGLVVRSLFTKDPYTVNWLKTPEFGTRIQELRQEVSFNFVHYDTISLAEYLEDTSKLPKSLTHHNIESTMMLRRARQEKNPLKRTYFSIEAGKIRRYERRVCARFDVNLTVSDPEKRLLGQLITSPKIIVIPNGVDTDYFKPSHTRPKKHSLLFSGSMDWYPNQSAITFFIGEIWPALRANFPDAHLTLVGKKPPYFLKRLAKKEKSLTVTGWVKDVRSYIEEAEVYICPIKDGGGTPLKILDAMAMGKAVISTSFACNGIDVSPGNNYDFRGGN